MNKNLYGLLKENALRQLDFQVSAIESIERKVGILLGVILGTPALILAAGESGGNGFLFLGALLISIVSAFYAVKSFWSRDVALPANLNSFFQENKKQNLATIRLNFIDDCHRCIDINAGQLKNKGDCFNIAIALFCSAVFIFITSLYIEPLYRKGVSFHGCKQEVTSEGLTRQIKYKMRE